MSGDFAPLDFGPNGEFIGGDPLDHVELISALLQELRLRYDQRSADSPPARATQARPRRRRGGTSIVIVTHNQLVYTQITLLSLRLFTDEPHEIIVVDNGSTDGTPGFVQQQPDVRLLRNSDNRGFPSACNQGLAKARGEQLLLLNNDVIVTPGWLGRLTRVLQADPTVGLVGPVSNNVSGIQKVPAQYRGLVGLEDFANDWAARHSGQSRPSERLVGFCLLFRREVYERIGILDERFGQGMFEDDDYCRRAHEAGYQSLIAGDVFIHHFGSTSFKALGLSQVVDLYERNRALFCEKWNLPLAAFEPKPPSASGSPSSDPPPRTTVSLAMIVRDNEETIGPCLESIRPWVDEMIVVDTGSTDATPEIARRLGARVFEFPWCDDFSAARNESLRHARGEWLFWMDSDDTIDTANGRRLRQLLAEDIAPEVLGFVMQVHCPGPGPDGACDVTVVDHVKLFRNLPDLKFDGRIHEQILPAIKARGGRVVWTDVHVVHSGYDHSPAGQERKKQRDLRILHQEWRDRPEHPFTLFNLGMTYAHLGEHYRAIDYLWRTIKRSQPADSHVRKAYALLVHSYRQVGRMEKAWEVCDEALRLFTDDPELLLRRGVLLQETARFSEAAETYRRVLQLEPPRQFSSYDRGIFGFKTRHNLALIYESLAQTAEALREWQRIVSDEPRYRVGWRGLAECLIKLGNPVEARRLAEHLVSQGPFPDEGHLILARLAQLAGDLASQRQRLELAVSVPDSTPEALGQLAQSLFQQGAMSEAERTLSLLTERQPQDAAAWQNLGTARLALGNAADAVDCYRRSLELRPQCAQASLFLGHALKSLDRNDEARAAWDRVIRLAPESPEAAEARAATVGLGAQQQGSATEMPAM